MLNFCMNLAGTGKTPTRFKIKLKTHGDHCRDTGHVSRVYNGPKRNTGQNNASVAGDMRFDDVIEGGEPFFEKGVPLHHHGILVIRRLEAVVAEKSFHHLKTGNDLCHGRKPAEAIEVDRVELKLSFMLTNNCAARLVIPSRA